LYGVGIDGIIIIQSSHVEVIFRVMERRLSQKRGGRVFFGAERASIENCGCDRSTPKFRAERN